MNDAVRAVGRGGKCLDVDGGAKNGAKIELFTCNGTTAQRWTYSSGKFIGQGGKCLDVTGAKSANGTKAQLWSCSGAANQHWSMVGGACVGARNTPGGPDPWGGCFPGDINTGVPAGITLVNVDTGKVNPPDSALPADNRGWEYSTSDGYLVVTAAGAVMDGISDKNGIYVPKGRSLTVKNSATGLINDEGSSLTVENSTLNGGDQVKYSTIQGGSDIAVLDSDLSGGEHEVLCYGGCTVRDSWLHNNANGKSAGAHQNGFLSLDGSSFVLQHSAVFCTGGCTSDIAFLDSGPTSNALVENNLLVAAPDAAYCAYPGPDGDPPENPATSIVWLDNVFQRGANGKCATYGPVYGWHPKSGTGDVWAGNAWDNGAALSE